MWMMPLHLHVNQKSDYDDDDVRFTPRLERTEVKSTDGFGVLLFANHGIHCLSSIVRQYASYILMNLRLIDTNSMDPDETQHLGTHCLQ